MATQRDITIDSFWKTSIFFFTQERPLTEQEYMEGYGLASHAWLAFRDQMDLYSFSSAQKKDFINLFNMAEDYFYYVNSEEYPYHSSFLLEKWGEIRRLANTLYRTRPQLLDQH